MNNKVNDMKSIIDEYAGKAKYYNEYFGKINPLNHFRMIWFERVCWIGGIIRNVQLDLYLN